jgi:hypothetical protein
MTSRAGRKALLAWQVGDGRGHVNKLRIVAEGLTAHGMTCAAALTRLDHANELGHVTSELHSIPPLPYFHDARLNKGHKPAATYGEFLGDLGFAFAEVVGAHVELWRRVTEKVAPDVVIGEQAPSALLAARSLRIPAVALGNCYTLPPPTLESFPILLDEYQERIWSEAAMCRTINEVVVPLGVAPLTRLAEIYEADAALPVGIGFLDPYARARGGPRVPPDTAGIRPREDWRRRKEVFVYLSTSDRSDPAMVDFVRLLRLPVRVYIANADAATAARFREAGAIVEERPVAPRDIARRSRVLFHAGNFGTMCLGIRAAIPQVSVPQQLEQMFNARRLESAGAARTVGWHGRSGMMYAHHVLELYDSERAHECALRLAAATADDFAGDGRALSAARILEVVG